MAPSCSEIKGSGFVTVPLYRDALERTLSNIPQFVVNADTTLAHSGADESTVIEPLEIGVICEKKPASRSFLIALIHNSFAYA